MELINFNYLETNKNKLKSEWNNRKPFKYLYFDGFFNESSAETIYNHYPSLEDPNWRSKTYINQQNKFVMTSFSDNVIASVFNELNSKKFLELLIYITGIEDLQGDSSLFGGGLHNSINGAFLDVHVDFNIHDITKQHRRANAIVFMNKDWKEEYNGYLELWDVNKKQRLEYIKPSFNRLVIFETNQISYHGHPKPINAPEGVSRKSIATYYYTKSRPGDEIVDHHNTKFVNTEGVKGKIKNLNSGIKALIERMK